jgi:hypothetical protein
MPFRCFRLFDPKGAAQSLGARAGARGVRAGCWALIE